MGESQEDAVVGGADSKKGTIFSEKPWLVVNATKIRNFEVDPRKTLADHGYLCICPKQLYTSLSVRHTSSNENEPWRCRAKIWLQVLFEPARGRVSLGFTVTLVLPIHTFSTRSWAELDIQLSELKVANSFPPQKCLLSICGKFRRWCVCACWAVFLFCPSSFYTFFSRNSNEWNS